MKDPGFKLNVAPLICAVCLALVTTVLAQSPETGAKISRSRPQVIYHLPPASNYAARLHSQAKSQINEPPIDSGPVSLQMSQAELNSVPVEPPQKQAMPSQQRAVRNKAIHNRTQVRPHSFARPSGHGNPHGNKSHRK
jgi:hypothetical protein